MKIYLDNCALGRLFDDQSQPRVRDETSAVKSILDLVKAGAYQWVASRAVELEIRANPDEERRRNALEHLAGSTMMQELTGAVMARSTSLRLLGFGSMDASHLSAAMEAGCGVLLTTDDRFISLARRIPALPRRLVTNPIDFLSR